MGFAKRWLRNSVGRDVRAHIHWAPPRCQAHILRVDGALLGLGLVHACAPSHEAVSGGQDLEGDPGGDTPGAVRLLQGSRASAEYKRVDRSLSEEGCPRGAGAQTGRLSKRSSCSYANACVPAPGTRGWGRRWCGLQAAFPHSLLWGLEKPKRWEPKRRRRQTPRRAALGASQCQPARGASETAWQPLPRRPSLPDPLSLPQLPRLHREMFRRAGHSARSLLESFYPGTRRRLPFWERREAINK